MQLTAYDLKVYTADLTIALCEPEFDLTLLYPPAGCESKWERAFATVPLSADERADIDGLICWLASRREGIDDAEIERQSGLIPQGSLAATLKDFRLTADMLAEADECGMGEMVRHHYQLPDIVSYGLVCDTLDVLDRAFYPAGGERPVADLWQRLHSAYARRSRVFSPWALLETIRKGFQPYTGKKLESHGRYCKYILREPTLGACIRRRGRTPQAKPQRQVGARATQCPVVAGHTREAVEPACPACRVHQIPNRYVQPAKGRSRGRSRGAGIHRRPVRRPRH